MAYRNYSVSNGFLVSSDGTGDFLTFEAALSASSAGKTIYLNPGTYTLAGGVATLKNGVNISAASRIGGSGAKVNIIGKLIDNGGVVGSTLTNLALQTSGDYLLSTTGSGTSIVLSNCYINCVNNTGISATNSSSVTCYDCYGDLGTTGIGYFAIAGGAIIFSRGEYQNSGNSTTASTVSSGSVGLSYIQTTNPITSSGTGGVNALFTQFNCGNTTALTLGGSGSQTFDLCRISSGTSSAISVGATAVVYNCQISSTNTNAIDGAGTLYYSNLSFFGSSLKINTTSQFGGVAIGGVKQAPTAGFIGEQTSGTGSGVSLSTGTTANIASVTLSAGIWDVSGMCSFSGTITGTQSALGISNTSATLPGTSGTDQITSPTVPTATSDLGLTVVAQRKTLTAASTTVYLVARGTYTVGTMTGSGYITATRVG